MEFVERAAMSDADDDAVGQFFALGHGRAWLRSVRPGRRWLHQAG